METEAATVCRGRPREFCVDEALSSALRVFWTHGYEGASLSELTEAMGITRPSLYAAFGNKESLFRKALDLYEREKLAYVGKALEAPTARAVAETMLNGSAEMLSSPTEPRGCLGVISSVACGAEAASIREEVLRRRASSEAALLRRFETAQAAGDLPVGMSAAAMVQFLGAVMQGMAVQAGAGASREDLMRLVATTLQLWPQG